MNQSQKILVVHHYGGVGGGTTSAIDIARMFREMNYDVSIGIIRPTDEVIKLITASGISIREDIPEICQFNYHNATKGQIKAFTKYLQSRRSQSKWEEFLLNNNYDLLVLNSIVQCPLIRVAKKLSIKCICFVRETICGSYLSLANSVIRRFLENASAVVYLTRYDLNSWHLPHDVKTYILHDVVDPKRFTIDNSDINNTIIEKRNLNDTLCILYLGGFSYSKGATDILKAFKLLIDAGIKAKLFMLGDHYDRFLELKGVLSIIHKRDIICVHECNELIKELNRNHKTVYDIGLVPNPYKWYLLSDVVVFPVKDVHQARPVYEAGYLRRPVILPKYPNFEEALEDNVNGMYYKRDDYLDLSRKLLQMRNPGLRKRMGNSNYEKTVNNHMFSTELETLRKIICDLEG